MCSQYMPPEPSEIVAWFDALEPTFAYPARTYKGYDAPIFVRPEPSDSSAVPLALRRARFGLVPFFSSSLQIKSNTMNARSETAASKPSYRGPWKRRQLCLVPMRTFIEPNYESGPSEWWGIGRADGQLLAAAGLYDVWRPRKDEAEAPGEPVYSFSLLTVNADEHPLMRRFHKKEDEKRSIVLVPLDQQAAWLNVGSDDELRSHLTLFDPDGFVAGPLPPADKPKRKDPEQPALDL
jgi:putative SOS response-associated peptidase YedK